MNADPQITVSETPAPPAQTRHLLERESPADYLREWTERIATEKLTAAAETKSVLVFRIGREWLGLPPRLFQQVSEPSRVHSLPHRRDSIVKGIVNIRGELIVCVSLGGVLGLEEVAAAQETGGKLYDRLLVANHGGNRLAFPVDEVHGVRHYHPGELRAAPSTLSESRITYTLGLLPWRDRTVGCLDDGLLFHTLNRSLA